MDKSTKYLFDIVRKLDLPAGDWVIFGSGPLVAHGIRDHAHDVDILARGTAWEAAKKLGVAVQATMRDHAVRIHDDTIEIFDGWSPGEWDTDELIDNAVIVDGLPFVQLEQVYKWKKIMGRVKDIKDIKAMDEYFLKND
ncbi:MAG: hypothetical protein ABH846_03840 [Patescibacteria group bacterium]